MKCLRDSFRGYRAAVVGRDCHPFSYRFWLTAGHVGGLSVVKPATSQEEGRKVDLIQLKCASGEWRRGFLAIGFHAVTPLIKA